MTPKERRFAVLKIRQYLKRARDHSRLSASYYDELNKLSTSACGCFLSGNFHKRIITWAQKLSGEEQPELWDWFVQNDLRLDKYFLRNKEVITSGFACDKDSLMRSPSATMGDANKLIIVAFKNLMLGYFFAYKPHLSGDGPKNTFVSWPDMYVRSYRILCELVSWAYPEDSQEKKKRERIRL